MNNIEGAPKKRVEHREVDPRKKPIDLFFLPHHEDMYHVLDPWEEKIRNTLAEKPTGKLVVFTELATGRRDMSDRVRGLVSNGVSPSDAYAQAIISRLREAGDDGTDSELENIALRSLSGFVGESSMRLDGIVRDFPGRIDWIIEGRRDDQELPEDDEDVKAAYTFLTTRVDGVPSDDHIDIYRESLATISHSDRVRDRYIAEQIAETLENPDTIGVAGWVGTKHTAISHKLKADGYTINRTFPQLEDGVLVFAPITTLIREAEYHPRREIPKEDIIVTTALANPVFDFDPNASDQQFFKNAHTWMTEKKAELTLQEELGSDQPLSEIDPSVNWDGTEDPDSGPRQSL